MAEYQLGVIGGGNMAEAIIRGVVRAGAIPAGQIVVSDPSPERRAVLAGIGVTATADNLAPAKCMRILLAVKPQMMSAVLAEIAPAVGSAATVVSIAAGITTAAIDKGLGGKGRIVRVMPNTPILVGQGMSALSAGPRADGGDLEWAGGMFSASGQMCIVDEARMDAVTAVSGSGPAYFFYMVEAMIEAGMAEGLGRDTATQLAVQTCQGAARLMLESNKPPEVLRAMVTSPNGTTQRAIETMDACGVKESIVKAVRAAASRSRELGK